MEYFAWVDVCESGEFCVKVILLLDLSILDIVCFLENYSSVRMFLMKDQVIADKRSV